MKKVVPFVILLVLLVSVSLVVAQGGLPGSGWKSGQQIQNVGTADAKVVFTAYDSNGSNFNCGEKTIAPGASETYLTDSDCPVPAGFIGSAVVSADQPIAAIVNVNNRGTGAAAGQYQGTDGADVSDAISFPLVKNGHSGRTTTFYVQNASTSPNNMVATFKVNGVEYTKPYNNVPGNAMVVVMPTDAGVPVGQGTGSLSVTGSQPLAGSSLEHEASAAVGVNLQASKAFTAADGSADVYCPLYRNKQTPAKGQTSGAQVQNVSGGTIDIRFTFNSNMGTFGPYTEANVADGDSVTFYAPSLGGIPDGAKGSAVIDADGAVVAVVNDSATDNGVGRKTTYACFGSGATIVNVPLAKEFAGGNTTGIQVQNVSGSPQTVTLEYVSSSASLVIESAAPVADGDSITAWGVSSSDPNWTVKSSSGSMAGTVNGVVVTAGGEVVAIANESSANPGASGQDTKNYEGFGQ